MAIYKRTARERQAGDEQAMRARRDAALVVARQAAQLLRERFGATRVILFGSLMPDKWFLQVVPIDLAVDSITDGEFYSAWGSINDLDVDNDLDVELLFNLVVCKYAPEHVRRSIEQGIEI